MLYKQNVIKPNEVIFYHSAFTVPKLYQFEIFNQYHKAY